MKRVLLSLSRSPWSAIHVRTITAPGLRFIGARHDSRPDAAHDNKGRPSANGQMKPSPSRWAAGRCKEDCARQFPFASAFVGWLCRRRRPNCFTCPPSPGFIAIHRKACASSLCVDAIAARRWARDPAQRQSGAPSSCTESGRREAGVAGRTAEHRPARRSAAGTRSSKAAIAAAADRRTHLRGASYLVVLPVNRKFDLPRAAPFARAVGLPRQIGLSLLAAPDLGASLMLIVTS